MKFSKRFTKMMALFMIALMVTIIPNMKVYSAVGNYATSSSAITANDNYSYTPDFQEKVAWPLAVAAGVALAVVVAVGVVDGWNSVHAEAELLASLDFEKNQSRNDFARFDN